MSTQTHEMAVGGDEPMAGDAQGLQSQQQQNGPEQTIQADPHESQTATNVEVKREERADEAIPQQPEVPNKTQEQDEQLINIEHEENIDNVDKLLEQSQQSFTNQQQQQQQQQQQPPKQQSQQQRQNSQSGTAQINSPTNAQFYRTAPENGIRDFYHKRRERQQAQKDAEILANRIALLKQEEIRTLKKIEETRKKALEVYYLKLKNDARQKRKKEISEMRRQQMQAPRRKSQERLDDERQVVSREDWVKMKRENVHSIKEQSRANEERIMQEKQKQIQKAREKKQKITEDKRLAKQKLDEHRFNKVLQIAVTVDYRAKLEEQNKLSKINEIKRMEDYEIELIQRLKSTQAMQQNAYEELENALMLTAQDFAQRYLTQDGVETDTLAVPLEQQSLALKQSRSQPDLRIDDLGDDALLNVNEPLKD